MQKKLEPAAIKAIEEILIRADQQGRQMLFEHEVYAVLCRMGLNIPTHIKKKRRDYKKNPVHVRQQKTCFKGNIQRHYA